MLICYWDANPVRLKRNAKHIAAVQMNNCFHRAAWVWRVAEGKVPLTFEPSCGGKGRLVSVSVWCSHSGKSHCGTKIRLGISQQINKSRSRNYFQHVPHIRAVNEECLWSTYWAINCKSNRSMWSFFSFTDALIGKKKKIRTELLDCYWGNDCYAWGNPKNIHHQQFILLGHDTQTHIWKSSKRKSPMHVGR